MPDYLPKVVITTKARQGVLTTGANTVIAVDGQEWPIFDYSVEGSASNIQAVTLKFPADVTITHIVEED